MELYYSHAITNSKSVCISTLTDAQLAECGAYEKFGSFGYFLYERHIADGEEEIEVLARLSSDDAAQKIAELMNMKDPRQPINQPTRRLPAQSFRR